ncbi:uncharacterized protein I303_101342 [Kwoniella dejecticola CBS 10117]|uniref:Nitroreductase domain-containing protein n=1 Tax=Kwoniella dejecticola CBS 10117 TaxID=1296121 RepID=A0A1A6AHN6_9TREE|nr:uncharacterized protein I303_01351 [Kwoniella dejecticola CBS 10117]OBR89523.1 hypothetical protein I303_01351 [Kwoniella dejecticola CBS 10117]
MSLIGSIEERRSHYVIDDRCDVEPAEVTALVKKVLRHVPSMFNMQSTRIVVLFGEHHRKLWDLVIGSLGEDILQKRPNVAHEHFSKVIDKLRSLQNGYGTLLFFEDGQTIEEIIEKYPAYRDKFETWSLQSSAIAQYAIWLTFTNLNPRIGMTLQHYYPDREEIGRLWGIPKEWKMTGQMPFGNIVEQPKEKSFKSPDDLVKVFT